MTHHTPALELFILIVNLLGGFKPGLSRKRPYPQILGGIRSSFHIKLQSLV